MSVLEYWNSLELELKMTSAMSHPHSTLSSIAFFISPFLRLVKVTCRASWLSWPGLGVCVYAHCSLQCDCAGLLPQCTRAKLEPEGLRPS